MTSGQARGLIGYRYQIHVSLLKNNLSKRESPEYAPGEPPAAPGGSPCSNHFQTIDTLSKIKARRSRLCTEKNKRLES